MANHILTISGSYRDNGIINQSLDVLTRRLQSTGHQVDMIDLNQMRIEFCKNCRHCTQQSGPEPGECLIDDDMRSLIDRIEAADHLILAAPVNFGAVTAIYKRFMERLICYGYWPWGKAGPSFRKPVTKTATLITSSAMPALMARFSTSTLSSLKYSAKCVGARCTNKLYIGLAAGRQKPVLAAGTLKKINAIAAKIAQST